MEQTAAAEPCTNGRELLYNATVEADADNDGYGDESQDLCTTNPGPGACPVPDPDPVPDPVPGPTQPATPPASPDSTAPAITGVSMSNKLFRVSKSSVGALGDTPRGTAFRFSLSEVRNGHDRDRAAVSRAARERELPEGDDRRTASARAARASRGCARSCAPRRSGRTPWRSEVMSVSATAPVCCVRRATARSSRRATLPATYPPSVRPLSASSSELAAAASAACGRSCRARSCGSRAAPRSRAAGVARPAVRPSRRSCTCAADRSS